MRKRKRATRYRRQICVRQARAKVAPPRHTSRHESVTARVISSIIGGAKVTHGAMAPHVERKIRLLVHML
jgi:hypothetical protein